MRKEKESAKPKGKEPPKRKETGGSSGVRNLDKP